MSNFLSRLVPIEGDGDDDDDGDEGHEQAVLDCGGAFLAGGDLAAELAHADLEVGVVRTIMMSPSTSCGG